MADQSIRPPDTKWVSRRGPFLASAEAISGPPVFWLGIIPGHITTWVAIRQLHAGLFRDTAYYTTEPLLPGLSKFDNFLGQLVWLANFSPPFGVRLDGFSGPASYRKQGEYVINARGRSITILINAGLLSHHDIPPTGILVPTHAPHPVAGMPGK